MRRSTALVLQRQKTALDAYLVLLVAVAEREGDMTEWRA
jgi:hypothetical protein